MYPWTKEAYAEYEASVREFHKRERIVCITTETETYCSSHGCDCCGSPEQQMLTEAPAIVRDDDGRETSATFQVCEDCVYYLEYGRLDDMQMEEIDGSRENQGDKT